MASASKRLNEKLAKYNHIYDEEDQSKEQPEDKLTSNGDAESTEPAASSNSNENNNVIEPERVPVKKIMENVSVRVNGNASGDESMHRGSNGVGDGVVTKSSNPANRAAMSDHVSFATSKYVSS